jgi:hypothetical protein
LIKKGNYLPLRPDPEEELPPLLLPELLPDERDGDETLLPDERAGAE